LGEFELPVHQGDHGDRGQRRLDELLNLGSIVGDNGGLDFLPLRRTCFGFLVLQFRRI
jgi:hypothetical protein